MNPWIRASDDDRERTVNAMRKQVGTGRLTLDEFSERTAEAYRARTVGELSALTQDLPSFAATAPTRVPPAALVAAILAAALLLGAVLLVLTGVAVPGSTGSMMDHMHSMMHR